MSKQKDTYEVFVSRHSLEELRKGHTNVIMGVIAKPRGIVGDKSAVIATLTVVQVKSSSSVEKARP